ncbi:hypothetical protein [Saccharothrix hoggarensis]|uniref:Uncharacterized protein n=1 Tax=Saccharothrix hoggarensis TaxID=913853 RepID=A0ABW3QGI6_9PSEU
MAGYANRVITLHFPELSEEGDDVFVVMRNPKTVTLSTLEVEAVRTNADGAPDDGEASKVVNGLMSRLIIGGRLYDASVDGVDAAGEPLDQPLLTYPLGPEDAAKLPIEVITGISEKIHAAQTPR